MANIVVEHFTSVDRLRCKKHPIFLYSSITFEHEEHPNLLITSFVSRHCLETLRGSCSLRTSEGSAVSLGGKRKISNEAGKLSLCHNHATTNPYMHTTLYNIGRRCERFGSREKESTRAARRTNRHPLAKGPSALEKRRICSVLPNRLRIDACFDNAR